MTCSVSFSRNLSSPPPPRSLQLGLDILSSDLQALVSGLQTTSNGDISIKAADDPVESDLPSAWRGGGFDVGTVQQSDATPETHILHHREGEPGSSC